MAGHLLDHAHASRQLVRQIGLGEVQIGKPVRIRTTHHMLEGRQGAGIDHEAVEAVHHRVEPEAHPIEGQRLPHRVENLEQEAGPILDAAAVFVIARVGTGGEELVDQVAVGGMDLHPVETRGHGIAGGAPEVLDDGGDLCAGERSRGHGRLHALGREHLPLRIDRRGRNR